VVTAWTWLANCTSNPVTSNEQVIVTASRTGFFFVQAYIKDIYAANAKMDYRIVSDSDTNRPDMNLIPI
jgi:low affinity Fe/Cu permease